MANGLLDSSSVLYGSLVATAAHRLELVESNVFVSPTVLYSLSSSCAVLAYVNYYYLLQTNSMDDVGSRIDFISAITR